MPKAKASAKPIKSKSVKPVRTSKPQEGKKKATKQNSNLKKEKRTEEKLLKCARCKQDFKPSQNNSNACQVEHTEDIDRISKRYNKSKWQWKCCGKKQGSTSPDSVDSLLDGYCYFGQHTTDPEEAEILFQNDYDTEWSESEPEDCCDECAYPLRRCRCHRPFFAADCSDDSCNECSDDSSDDCSDDSSDDG